MMGPQVESGADDDLDQKQRTVRDFLVARDLEAVLLCSPANFAWITGGGTNTVGLAAERTSAGILVSREGRFLVAEESEAQRLLRDELAGSPITLLSYPWYQPGPTEVVRRHFSGQISSDLALPGFEPLPAEFSALQWSLSAREVERIRWLGEHAAVAMTHALFHLRPGMSEQMIAGLLAEVLIGLGIQPAVLLVGADERLAQPGRLLPTEKRLERAAMLAVRARRWGLTVALARLVHFGDPSPELRKQHDAATAVDAVYERATRAGAVVGEILRRGIAAYAAYGYADEWARHDQGGAAGFDTGDDAATPECSHLVRDQQAFAWHPSVAGVRSEETFLVTTAGAELLTTTPDLPSRELDGVTRTDILVR